MDQNNVRLMQLWGKDASLFKEADKSSIKELQASF